VSADPRAGLAAILALLPVTEGDVTGLFTLKEVPDARRQRGGALFGAGWQAEWRNWMATHGFNPDSIICIPLCATP